MPCGFPLTSDSVAASAEFTVLMSDPIGMSGAEVLELLEIQVGVHPC